MAYQAKRSKKVVEEFELVNENGQVEHELRVELDAGSMAEKISRKYVALARAQNDAAKISAALNRAEEMQDAYANLGLAVIDLVESVFGAEDAKVILDFYSNNYADISKEVLPFIANIVLPKLRTIASQNKQEILSRYNRKTRRAIKKGMIRA